MDPRAETSRHFDGDPASALAARRWVARMLMGWAYDGRLADVAVLVANELAVNAVLHARTHFELRLLLYEERLRIEVFDLNLRLPIAALVPEDATSGRGLPLVESLASSWGVESHGEGKIVWAELGPGVPPRFEPP